MLDVEFAQLSDTGRERKNNEDYAGCVCPEPDASDGSAGWLFALADGVGGQDDGEVASHQAVESLLSGFRASPADEMYSAMLPRLMQAANAAVFEIGTRTAHGRMRMATTLVACALRYNSAVIAHVGDSRCYSIRGLEVEQLTRDHTMANEQLRLGLLTPREAQNSRMRQMLTRSLGQELIAKIDSAEYTLIPGDILLLCSDGLHGSVSEREIATIVAKDADLHRAAQELVALANRRDGSDNITVQLIRVRNVEQVGMYRGRPYKLR